MSAEWSSVGCVHMHMLTHVHKYAYKICVCLRVCLYVMYVHVYIHACQFVNLRIRIISHEKEVVWLGDIL